MRYFKKFYPKQKLVLSNGRGITFDATSVPNIGLHSTTNEFHISEFKKAESENIGGVSEITATEFEDIKKKLPPPNRNKSMSAKTFAEARLAGRRAAAERAGKGAQLTPNPRMVNNPGSLNTNRTGYRPGTVDRP